MLPTGAIALVIEASMSDHQREELVDALDEPAQQGSDGGAAVAGPDAAELAQPAWLFVTEGNGDEGAIGNEAGIGREGGGGSEGSGREGAAPAMSASNPKAGRAARYEVVMEVRTALAGIEVQEKSGRCY